MYGLLPKTDIYASIDNVNVVSFDVFDTLVTRDVTVPDHVFRLVHSSEPSFAKARILAEDAARLLSRSRYGHSETQFDQIFQSLPSRLRRLHSLEAELSAERKFLKARTPGLALLRYAQERGKRVIAISDVYLSADALRSLLVPLNIEISEIYTSADHGGGKHDGALFAMVAEHLSLDERNAWLHIGDNRQSDYVTPLSCGIQAIHVPKSTDLLFRDASFNLNAIDRVRRTDSVLGSFLVARLARLRETPGVLDSDIARFGAMYAGPLVASFCCWLAERAKADGIDELVLLARDGHVIKDAMNILHPELKTRVMLCSRRSLMLPAVTADHDQLQHVVNFRGYSARAGLQGLSLNNIECILDRMTSDGIDIDAVIITETQQNIIDDWVRKNWKALFEKQALSEASLTREYCHSLGLNKSNLAIVDVGWSLSSHKALDALLGRPIRGYYLASTETAYHHHSISAFLSARGADAEWSDLIRRGVELLELPFISDTDQTIRLIPDAAANGFDFHMKRPSHADRSRRLVATEIQRQVLSFCTDLRSAGLPTEAESTMRDVLRALFVPLITAPTPSELWSLGEILHDRPLFDAPLSDIRDFWRLGDVMASPESPSIPSLILHFFHVVKRQGALAALGKLSEWTRRRLQWT